MDALGGRAGGSKANPTLHPIVPNDNQFFRATVEKSVAPKQAKTSGGKLTVGKFKARR